MGCGGLATARSDTIGSFRRKNKAIENYENKFEIISLPASVQMIWGGD